MGFDRLFAGNLPHGGQEVIFIELAQLRFSPLSSVNLPWREVLFDGLLALFRLLYDFAAPVVCVSLEGNAGRLRRQGDLKWDSARLQG